MKLLLATISLGILTAIFGWYIIPIVLLVFLSARNLAKCEGDDEL